MWTVENRARYDRSWLRYPSGLTDEEWALVRPQIPRARRGGNKRSEDERAVMNGLMYVLSMYPKPSLVRVQVTLPSLLPKPSART